MSTVGVFTRILMLFFAPNQAIGEAKMYDYNQMLNMYASVGQYSAKAEKETAQAAKKQAKLDSTPTKCGNFSCRLCYGLPERIARAVSREIKADDTVQASVPTRIARDIATNPDRRKAEQDLQDFLHEQRSRRIEECVERIITCAKGEISI
jgi:hypothetical protein